MRKLFALVVAGVVLAPGLAVAQTVIQEPDKVVYQRKTIIDIGETTVIGDIDRPNGSMVMAKAPAKFKCLVNVRGSFTPELAASVDALH